MAKSSEVLRIYRQVLKLARSWEALEADHTPIERAYIKEEANKLFRKNQHLSDGEEIQRCIDEATSRLALGSLLTPTLANTCDERFDESEAQHYGIPYPRLANVAPNTVMASRHGKTQVRANRQSKPVYLHSQD